MIAPLLSAAFLFAIQDPAPPPAKPLDSDVVYRTVDGADLKMDVAVPEGKGPFPVVICLHGGGWSMGNKRSFHGIIRGLSEQGFVAATVQYRFAPGARHPAQVEDIRSAVGFLRESAARWKADPAKVVLMGASAGGHLALLAGLPSAALPSPVQAIVDISGPTDLRDWKMNENAERTLRETTGKTTESLLSDLLGTAARDAEIVRRASPVTLVNSKSPPVLIFHWKEDQAVALSQAERLVTALSAARVQHEIIRFEGRGHALNGPGVEQIVPLTVRFLRRVLH